MKILFRVIGAASAMIIGAVLLEGCRAASGTELSHPTLPPLRLTPDEPPYQTPNATFFPPTPLPVFEPEQTFSAEPRFILGLQADILPGDGDEVPSVMAFAPGSQILAVGSVGTASEGTVELWHAPSARRIATLQEHTGWVTALAFTPDGALLATADYDGVVRLGRTESGETTATLTGHEGPVWDVAFSPDGTLVATAGQDLTVRLWDARDGRLLATGRAHMLPPRRLQFSPDGSRLVSAGVDGALVIWSTPGLDILQAIVMHGEAVTDVTFVPESNLIISVSADDTMRLWDMETGEELRVINTQNRFLSWVRVIGADPIRALTVARNGDVRLWRIINSGGVEGPGVTELWRADPTVGNIWAVGLSPDRTLLALGDNMGVLSLYDPEYGRPVAFPGTIHGDGIVSLAFSDDGALLATAGLDGHVRVWVAEPPLPTPTPVPWTAAPGSTPEATPTPTGTPTPGGTIEATLTETPIPAETVTQTPTGTPLPAEAATPTPTETGTPIPTPTETPTPTAAP